MSTELKEPVTIYEATEANKTIAEDLAISTLLVRVVRSWMEMLESESGRLSPTLKNAAYRVHREAVEFERKSITALKVTYPDLKKEIEKDKIHDIACILELMMQMGREQKAEEYEEFFTTVLDYIKIIIRAQINDRKLHFGKYRALFRLLLDELKYDAAGLPGQFDFIQGRIYPRLNTPKEELK